MIHETIVTTVDTAGRPHVAPMGVWLAGDAVTIRPFRPSRTLDNLLATGSAVVNATDDVRPFAGCVTGRGGWPTEPAEVISGARLAGCLSHLEARVRRVIDDPVRPTFECRVLHRAVHGAFTGFNRAQAAVIEGAILVSRLDRLPLEEVEGAMARLAVWVEKTAGEREREAWGWLVDHVAARRAGAA